MMRKARMYVMCDFDKLYSWVKDLPIIDWHNHLDMSMLAEDKPLGSLYEVWVKSDPYKHRAMRICGEPECVITGDASEDEKWAAWRRTFPKLVGNPLFAWAKMEMEFLGIDGAENVSLAECTPSRLLKAFNVEYCDPGYRMDVGVAADFAEMERVHARGQQVIAHTPMGRFGEAQDLLGCVNWLLDDSVSSFVTGITVPVDGGFLSSAGV